MAEIFTVETRGVGKPDYSKAVSSARERAGISAKYNQTLLIFARTFSAVASLTSWVRAPLAIAGSEHLMDVATGLAMPYTIPAGYTLTFVESEGSHTEDIAMDTYYEPATPPGLQLAVCERFGSGLFIYAQEISAFTSTTLDPTGATAHQIDVILTNLGGGAAQGGTSILAILEAVGTPPLPNIKTVKCKHCGFEHAVPLDTSTVMCPECGLMTIYRNLSRFRGSV